MSNPSIEVPFPPEFEVYARTIELRMTALEQELQQLKAGMLVSSVSIDEIPWWVKISGSFATNPLFDDAVRYGQEWRNSGE